MVARVTSYERRLARAMARDNARAVRWGVEAATLAGSRAMRAAIAAYRRRDPRMMERVRAELMSVVPKLRDAMTMARLTGLERGRELASVRLGHKSAIAVLRRRLEIPHAELVELGNKHEMHAIEMLSKAGDAAEARLQATMLDLTTRGAHVKEGVEGLGKTFEAMGITPRNSFQLEAIFRTQTQLAYSAGQWEACQDPVVDEILWGYKYVTVGDDRVRDEHAELEGTTLSKNDPMWDAIWPPNGWACRCVTIPIFEERDPVRPRPVVERDGKTIRPGPDNGFRWHPGKVLAGDRRMTVVALAP